MPLQLSQVKMERGHSAAALLDEPFDPPLQPSTFKASVLERFNCVLETWGGAPQYLLGVYGSIESVAAFRGQILNCVGVREDVMGLQFDPGVSCDVG